MDNMQNLVLAVLAQWGIAISNDSERFGTLEYFGPHSAI